MHCTQASVAQTHINLHLHLRCPTSLLGEKNTLDGLHQSGSSSTPDAATASASFWLWAASSTPPGYPEATFKLNLPVILPPTPWLCASNDAAGARTTDFWLSLCQYCTHWGHTASTDHIYHQHWHFPLNCNVKFPAFITYLAKQAGKEVTPVTSADGAAWPTIAPPTPCC